MPRTSHCRESHDQKFRRMKLSLRLREGQAQTTKNQSSEDTEGEAEKSFFRLDHGHLKDFNISLAVTLQPSHVKSPININHLTGARRGNTL